MTRAGLACALVLGLSACAQQKPLYSWQSYQPSVYAIPVLLSILLLGETLTP
ncbi:putative lipoprotein, partial [Bordetella hinzii CA90 BAL1384]